MGTPQFAVPALKGLIASDHHTISAVFTGAPKAKGRGLKEQLSPIHSLALEHNITIYTPATLRSAEIYSLIDSIEADIIIVAAYGFLIPKEILFAKKYGSVNIHPSALPRFRGAAPLQRTIIEGDKSTEICIIQMDEGLDTGDILMKEYIELSERITLAELHDIASHKGADLLLKVLDNIDILVPEPQSTEGIVYAKKLNKSEGLIDWNHNAFKIDCQIRGMNPWPGAYFLHNGNIIKILDSKPLRASSQSAPGTVIDDSLKIACKDSILEIHKLQKDGKAAMNVTEFLRGYKITKGEILGN